MEWNQIASSAIPAKARVPASVGALYWLQGITILWMLTELGVSTYAAWSAKSSAMLAFGADSLVEVLSAFMVMLQWVPGIRLSERKAARAAAFLLFMLAGVVGVTAVASLVFGVEAETCGAGLAITAAALVVMPLLAMWKRREARARHNAALAADAAQSSTCAYLALTALLGMGLNRAFHLPWFDNVAALACLPLLVREARSAWNGAVCGCCRV
ncbi:cation transporter [Silvibacterium sp.]|uniref:cation transporter n=1 Tax=Silvibacterium sp. TaxID=1964179 RepID=UPI0039E5B7A5